MLQCGDPTGTGTGGPGYTSPTSSPAGRRTAPGTLAMANTGQPDTNGSQFFLVYGDTPAAADVHGVRHMSTRPA